MEKYLTEILKERNMTQTALADKIGICRQSLSLKVKGKRPLLLSEAKAISKVLGISIDSLAKYV